MRPRKRDPQNPFFFCPPLASLDARLNPVSWGKRAKNRTRYCSYWDLHFWTQWFFASAPGPAKKIAKNRGWKMEVSKIIGRAHHTHFFGKIANILNFSK